MGRPMLTAPFTAIIPSPEVSKETSAEVVGKDAGPRRWCKGDADPDEEAWWSGREIFIESFIQTTGGITANMENVSPRDGNQSRSTTGFNEGTGSCKLMPQVSPIEKHAAVEPSRPPIELFFPQRFTISEEQLATSQLDTISSDPEEDFELDWETGSDSDMDFHTNSSTPDSQSEVSSSPPARSMLRSMTSIPIAVPRTPTRSRTLPISGTPMATSACQSGFHMSPPAIASLTSGSPISARSIPRVRGFAVHSPRTELVL